MIEIDCSETPLAAFVADGMLQIRVGVSRLAFDDIERLQIKVTDATGFAQDVAKALMKEREDGSSILYYALDAAQEAARDDGSQYVEHPKLKLCPVCHGVNEGTDFPTCINCNDTGEVAV